MTNLSPAMGSEKENTIEQNPMVHSSILNRIDEDDQYGNSRMYMFLKNSSLP